MTSYDDETVLSKHEPFKLEKANKVSIAKSVKGSSSTAIQWANSQETINKRRIKTKKNPGISIPGPLVFWEGIKTQHKCC